MLFKYGFCISSKWKKPINSKKKIIQQLKSFGITDEEINDLGDEGIANFLDKQLVAVNTSYYQIDNNTGKTKKITNNDYISLTSSDSETSSDRYMKQTIYVAKCGGTDPARDYNISLTCKWLKVPKNRKIDVFGIGLSSNLNVVKGSQTVWHKANTYLTYSDGTISGSVTSTGVTNITDLKWGNGVAAKFKLFENYPVSGTLLKVFVDEYAYMTVDVDMQNKSDTSFSVNGNYIHQEKTIQISPGISGISFSAGISLTSSTDMVEMTPNAYINYSTFPPA